MDPLSDLLRAGRLDGAYFYSVEAAGWWSVEAGAAGQLSPRIMPASEHLIPYHILTAGHCFGGLVGEDQVELGAGDVLIFPHGDAHKMSSAGFGAFTRQVTEESRAGADGVLTRLAELMFIEVVRRYLDDLPSGQTGWLAGLRDEVVGRALALLHDRPGQAWTLADLARQSASSRTQLAERFTLLVGRPPMQYLTQWRMQVAANRLLQTGAKVAAVGGEVGYDSEAAFSRAFKKATGHSPGAWREARRSAGPWRATAPARRTPHTLPYTSPVRASRKPGRPVMVIETQSQ